MSGVLPPPTTPERQAIIDNVGRISKTSFLAVLWTFCGVATLAVILRITFRLRTRGKLTLDDYVVIFAAVVGIVANTVLFIFSPTLYLIEALNLDTVINPEPQELPPLLLASDWRTIILALSWTSICAIKFSFLIFFKDLIRNVSKRITRWYWICVGATCVATGFLFCQGFILCPHFGEASAVCFPDSDKAKSITTNTIAATVDIVSDAMIVSVPILVLYRAQMKKTQKVQIAVFLCLSVVMIAFALIRVAGASYPSRRATRDFDITWQAFWQHVENNLAVFMGAVMMMRSLFIARIEKSKSGSNGSSSHTAVSLARKSWCFKNGEKNDIEFNAAEHALPIPISDLHRDSGNSSRSLMPQHGQVVVQHSTVQETCDLNDMEDEYHNFKRHDKANSFSQWDFDLGSRQPSDPSSSSTLVDKGTVSTFIHAGRPVVQPRYGEQQKGFTFYRQ